jgi:acetylglutamate kinase
MTKNQKSVIVVKIGGSTLGQHDTTMQDLVELQKKGLTVVVVHGGGKVVTEWLGKLNASTQFVQGERVTDKVGLEVVTAVLSGLVNKELVAALGALGGRAIGLSGVDGGLLQGQIKNPDLGYVGTVIKVNTEILEALLKTGYIPVVSSISFNSSQNKKPSLDSLLLNVNADIAAGEIANALNAEKLIFLTDIAGVCDKDGKVISRLNVNQAESLVDSGVATSGMIPKIRSCIRAIEKTGQTRIVDGRRPHALLNEIENSEGGTTIYRK